MEHSSAEDRWRGLIAEQERSGRSVREFAEEHGFSAWTMYGWRRRLGLSRRRSERPASGRRTPRTDETLVPVELVEDRPRWPGGEQRIFEVMVGPVRIQVPPGFDAEELGRLVSVLRSAC